MLMQLGTGTGTVVEANSIYPAILTVKVSPYRYVFHLLFVVNEHCCGSGRFLTGSDFRKRPDPDPDPNISLANFFLNFFFDENTVFSKKYLHGPKSI
jgi:hypothetical protein